MNDIERTIREHDRQEVILWWYPSGGNPWEPMGFHVNFSGILYCKDYFFEVCVRDSLGGCASFRYKYVEDVDARDFDKSPSLVIKIDRFLNGEIQVAKSKQEIES